MSDKLDVINYELLGNELSIGTVEQCTYGLLGASIASKCDNYKGTIVTVDVEHAKKLLDLSSYIFGSNDMVTSQVACQMALSGLHKLDVDICIATVGSFKSKNDVAWICIAVKSKNDVSFNYDKVNVNTIKSESISKILDNALTNLISELKKSEVNYG